MSPAATPERLTLAISAQLFPASLMFFNLCSSAGVHGVFVRLFFAGGPMGEDVVLGSSAPMDGGGALIALDGPDIGRADVDIPDARLLFRALDNKVPGLMEVSAVVGRGCEGEIPDAESSSVRSARFDIGDDVGCDVLMTGLGMYAAKSQIEKAGEKGQVLRAR
jgi:hypothetical protein